MSGHNKWAQIKHKKAITDAKKSKIFSKMVKEISVQARLAGGDTTHPALRAAIEKARSVNMPADNIDRAIKKANETKENLERTLYEAYGPGGVGLLIEALTGNRNKASQEIKHVLATHEAVLGTPGSVSWAFEKKDGTWIAQQVVDVPDDALHKLDDLIEALEACDEVQDVFTNANEL